MDKEKITFSAEDTKRIRDNVPTELMELKQWVCYRGRDKKPLGKSNDPSTWSTLDEMLAAANGKAQGVGFVFSDDDPYVGIDLDHCIEGGKVSNKARKVISRLRSYTEISPSGKGIHIIGRVTGELPKAKKAEGMEVYAQGRYFTVTGNVYNGMKHIRDFGDELREWTAETFGQKKKETKTLGDVIPEGERNNTLTSIAGGMRRQGVSEDAIKAALSVVNLTKCQPPLSDDEVSKIAKSVMGYEAVGRGPSSFFEGKQFVPKRVADVIREKHRFKNFKDSQLFVYSKGVYQSNGQATIRNETQDRLREAFRQNRANEVIFDISVSSYTEEDPNGRLDILNLQNGLLDTRTEALSPHTPHYFSTTRIPVTYDPEATCPVIDTFFSEVLPGDCLHLAYEIFGYCLVPDVSFQKAFMLIGEGANGKGTFLSLLEAFLGPENVAKVKLQEIGDRFKTAELQGKLANVFADLDYSALKSSGYFKMIVAGDPLTAERKNRDPFTFRPHSRLLFSANKIPRSYDVSFAFYRRWCVIPFPNRFTGQNEDKKILKALTQPEELSGLLNRALYHLKLLYERGEFTEAKSTTEAMKNYQTANEPVKQFVEESCVVDADMWVMKTTLYTAFSEWFGKKAMSQRDFNVQLLERFPVRISSRARESGGSNKVWTGIGLLSEIREPGENG